MFSKHYQGELASLRAAQGLRGGEPIHRRLRGWPERGLCRRASRDPTESSQARAPLRPSEPLLRAVRMSIPRQS